MKRQEEDEYAQKSNFNLTVLLYLVFCKKYEASVSVLFCFVFIFFFFLLSYVCFHLEFCPLPFILNKMLDYVVNWFYFYICIAADDL